ncbi:TPA: cysteine desulfurase sulfur acceptor subunit CsdE [Klebsiella aerogenes]|uniref:cysteine desulfurase sulfur acceptor subunit CsdE n=1 Tax=Klebsiella aerogenes TaxID=548 RepID=UPI00051737DD|nr:cysteine desulfurase sulfur acceptor subunit CsdE [Klebsiella aerogenes]ELA1946773.1 cysteine desulfurase sulfur acceptor subunit CsdE [Klebsiella aerogenes]ELT6137414.1 cysteine desulfurase sulfur acceptor subunit CsdE [Klebsiella aerogenes]EMA4695063.1 cysteine desulfurase sulfur acceptor subunit CsdE [Klebsiella aerogenes]KLF25690.1 CsdA-binding activator [Klebsiella aerogenes]WVJ31649.1 cysteine desulfurase sulfur acceptor subunit CsdE [Klebsiella aerogenes]
MMTSQPLSATLNEATLRQIFAPLTQWEDKYRQLILVGKKLPPLMDEQRAQAKEIAGCENRVWLGYQVDAEGKMHFFGDSEGRIVRGLLAVLLAACEGKSAAEILANDPLALFDELGLRGQLSASRSQGLQALIDAVLAAAREN